MIRRFVFALTLCLPLTAQAQKQESYPVHPDSLPQEGVPKGEIKGPFEWRSRIFPGTVRQYWVYVPAQYKKEKPACVMIVQDGLRKAQGWKVPTVLDNLIHKGDVPVQIGIFITPGVVPAANRNAQGRFNRSFEYDGMGDRYARFLIEEILPEVSKSYNLSEDPNDCLIAGSSSGAICAFTAAWERPDRFRRVFSSVGTFVSLRGGNEYEALVRKYESKPIRIFLQDGSNDNNLYGGSWWVANQAMLASLQFSGYDVRHVWGEGGHNSRHSTAILPDALRWLWKNYPEPIEPGIPPRRRTDLVIPGEEWQLVSTGHDYTDGPAVNSKGEVFYSDAETGELFKVGLDGKVSKLSTPGRGLSGLMFGPDGRLYGCDRLEQTIVRIDEDGAAETFLDEAPANDLVILHDGSGYSSDPTSHRIWHFTKDGTKQVVDEGIEFPNGLVTSPDQTLLFASDTHGRFSYAFQIRPDGTLAHRQRYGHVHVPDDERSSGGDGWTVDTEGRRYLATKMGLQIFDQLGRCHLILVMPPGADWMSNVCFGGPELDTLYVTCRDKVFKRKIKAKGVLSWQAPVKPPRPRL